MESEEEGLFEDAYLEYTLDGLSLITPIQATITTCQVEKLSFIKPLASISYQIGSGSMYYDLPMVV